MLACVIGHCRIPSQTERIICRDCARPAGQLGLQRYPHGTSDYPASGDA
jgi:hypothetical protein